MAKSKNQKRFEAFNRLINGWKYGRMSDYSDVHYEDRILISRIYANSDPQTQTRIATEVAIRFGEKAVQYVERVK